MKDVIFPVRPRAGRIHRKRAFGKMCGDLCYCDLSGDAEFLGFVDGLNEMWAR